jgi:putative AlgH/UPF0301 family transcriptional regulator
MAKRIVLQPGCLLVAEPLFYNNNLKNTVVLLISTSEEEVKGFVINKFERNESGKIKIDDAIEDFPPFNSHLYFGGTEQNDSVFWLHRLGRGLDGSVPILDGLYLHGNIETLKYQIMSGKLNPEWIRFYRGYTSWEFKTLVKEIQERNWIILQNNGSFLFPPEPESLWERIMSQFGGFRSLSADDPNILSLN